MQRACVCAARCESAGKTKILCDPRKRRSLHCAISPPPIPSLCWQSVPSGTAAMMLSFSLSFQERRRERASELTGRRATSTDPCWRNGSITTALRGPWVRRSGSPFQRGPRRACASNLGSRCDDVYAPLMLQRYDHSSRTAHPVHTPHTHKQGLRRATTQLMPKVSERLIAWTTERDGAQHGPEDEIRWCRLMPAIWCFGIDTRPRVRHCSSRFQPISGQRCRGEQNGARAKKITDPAMKCTRWEILWGIVRLACMRCIGAWCAANLLHAVIIISSDRNSSEIRVFFFCCVVVNKKKYTRCFAFK